MENRQALNTFLNGDFISAPNLSHCKQETTSKEVIPTVRDHPTPDSSSFSTASSSTGAKGSKRTVFTRHQLTTLEDRFRSQSFLSREERLELADLLELTDRQIMVWFQNRRGRLKKRGAADKAFSANKLKELNRPYPVLYGVLAHSSRPNQGRLGKLLSFYPEEVRRTALALNGTRVNHQQTSFHAPPSSDHVVPPNVVIDNHGIPTTCEPASSMHWQPHAHNPQQSWPHAGPAPQTNTTYDATMNSATYQPYQAQWNYSQTYISDLQAPSTDCIYHNAPQHAVAPPAATAVHASSGAQGNATHFQ